jgi:hypothetical protein
MNSLRSRSSGSCCLHGMWSIMMNLNPSELDCPVVFEIAGHRYSFDSEGVPQGRPGSRERWRILSEDSVAEAQMMALIVRAFADHILHFPVGAAQQQQRDIPCLFGVVLAWFFKYESAMRRSIHGHGCAALQHLQPDVLEKLRANPATAARLCALVEQVASAFLPSPFHSKEVFPAGVQLAPEDLLVAHTREASTVSPMTCRPPLPPLPLMEKAVAAARGTGPQLNQQERADVERGKWV